MPAGETDVPPSRQKEKEGQNRIWPSATGFAEDRAEIGGTSQRNRSARQGRTVSESFAVDGYVLNDYSLFRMPVLRSP